MNNIMAQLRRKRKLSQVDLSEMVGVSRISISKIENCKCVPSLKLANDIAKAFNLTLYEVFDLDGTGTFKKLK